MTHRGPFQPLLFCDSVILSRDYFKSTVDLRRHRSGVMKPPRTLPGFVHPYARRCPEFNTCTSCAASLPHPCVETNLMKPLREEAGAQTQARSSVLQPPGQRARASTSAGQHGRRGSHGLVSAGAAAPAAYPARGTFPPLPAITWSSLPCILVPVWATLISLLNLSAV